MTPSPLEQAEQRVAAVLPYVDAKLRRAAVHSAVFQALVLTDGQVQLDTQLASALVRVAHELVARLHRGEVEDAKASSAPPGRALSIRARAVHADQAACDRADKTDTCLVAVRAAHHLVQSARPSAEERHQLGTVTELAEQIASTPTHPLIRHAALQLLHSALQHFAPEQRGATLGVPAIRRLRQLALGVTASRHVQCAAWPPLAHAMGSEISQVLSELLRQPCGLDDALLRHHLLVAMPHWKMCPKQRLAFIAEHHHHRSEHVRQGVVLALISLGRGDPSLYRTLSDFACQDGCPRIVALAALQLSEAYRQPSTGLGDALLDVLALCASSAEPALHRALMRCCELLSDSLGATALRQRVLQLLQQLIDGAQVDSAERAACIVRRLAVESDPEHFGLCQQLSKRLRSCREGEAFEVTVPPALSEATLLQIAFAASCFDLPLQLRRRGPTRILVLRGERRGLRLWRLWHELRHFGPDKRQSHLHSHARLTHAHPATVPIGLAEVTATSVPGERRAVLGHSWGSFLPRVDDLLGACQSPTGKTLATALGVLKIQPPASYWARCKLRLQLTAQYPRLCALREQALAGTTVDAQRSFSRTIAQMGLSVTRHEVELQVGCCPLHTRCPAAQRYFQALPLSWVLWLEDALQYVVSPSGNTAWHLALLVWLVLVGMLWRSGRVQRRFAHSKRRIALSVGGWGSRGKSGTERLKSALFHSLHLDVVSKTTGCEAMLILARRGQVAQELFLYRPYDKATIWEQELSVSYAKGLGAQVFLWECMALNPAFVDILNREWMQDTITTITNAYPDHEDIMGPTGEDVARTVARFVPDHGTVLSSEDQMQAFVRESAEQRGSHLVEVDELAADLLPRDLLDRFPYQEHPRNIALALRMAEHLKLDPTTVLYDLADFVVPDLGVLKTFPRLSYRQRSLVFSNGMSANERAGFLSNWQRLQYADHDPDAAPQVQTLVVVNNRSDRVARSRVFAKLCARDIRVDTIAIIGTNGDGLWDMLRQAATEQVDAFSPPNDPTQRGAWVDEAFARLNTPQHLATVEARLRAALEAGSPEGTLSESALTALREALQQLEQVGCDASTLQTSQQLRDRAHQILAPLCAGLDEVAIGRASWQPGQMRRWLSQMVLPWLANRQWRSIALQPSVTSPELLEGLREVWLALFEDKCCRLANTDASGDAVIDFVFQQIWPGAEAKVLGCQNIKGTGLDFVYRFLSLQRLHDLVQRLEHSPADRIALVADLHREGNLGLFDCQLLVDEVSALLQRAGDSLGTLRPSLSQLVVQWTTQRDARIRGLGQNTRQSPWLRALSWLEPLVDHLDAIGRRRRADAIMKRLVASEIDVREASECLREVVARQKGGWLAKDVQNVLKAIRARRVRVAAERREHTAR